MNDNMSCIFLYSVNVLNQVQSLTNQIQLFNFQSTMKQTTFFKLHTNVFCFSKLIYI